VYLIARVEAIIIGKNRRPQVVRVKKPGQSTVTVGKNGNEKEYHLNPDCTVFGSYKPGYFLWLKRMDCNRYYFNEGNPSPIPMHNLAGIKQVGITPKELALIFNPRFYAIIAKAQHNPKLDYILYAAIAAAGLAAYCAWQLSQVLSRLNEMGVPPA